MTAKAFVNGEVVDIRPEDHRAFVTSQISPDEVAEKHRITSIKALVAERILALAPLHTQQNLSAHCVDVMARRAAGEVINAEDVALEASARAVMRKIAAIRAAGKAAIASGTAADAVVWPEQ
jgi:hypothetical protein